MSSKAFRDKKLEPFLRHTGPALSPFNAWVLLKGLETLGLRVERHCAAAVRIAELLAGHPKVERVLYPGRADHPQAALAQRQMSAGGSVVTFDVAGGRAGAFRLLNGLELVDISNNLGDAKSLVTHPATTTHRAMGPEGRAAVGIGDGMVRISVGLEAVEDIADDLTRALARV
jgi:O-succinylhomoserine sulfhydrylase